MRAVFRQVLGVDLAIFGVYKVNSIVQLNLVAPVLNCLITLLLLKGVQDSSLLNKIMVVVNLTLLVLFATAGFALGSWDNFEHNFNVLPADSGSGREEGELGVGAMAALLSGILGATGQAYYCFIGFDAVCMLSQEALDPARAIPISLFTALFIVFAVYSSCAAALCFMVEGLDEVDENAPLSAAFLRFDQVFIFHLISVAAVTNTVCTAFCGLMAQPRLWLHQAQDGLLPASLAVVDPASGVPRIGTFASGVIALLGCGFFKVDLLADICSAGLLSAYCLINIALIVGRYQGLQCGDDANSSGPGQPF